MDIRLTPTLWPYKSVLPVRRIGGDSFWNDDDLGVLTHDLGKIRPVVYLINIADVTSKDVLAFTRQEAYASLEHLYENWEVD